MRAVVCEALGDPLTPLGQGVLRLAHDAPPPAQLPPGHLRLRVAAASLNFPDALQIKGEYQSKPKLPFIPGNEVSGVVTEVGPGVRGFNIGQRVCAVRELGAFAEECVVHAGGAWVVPDSVDLTAASAIPIVFGTADLALRHRARLKAGQTLLVLGASGGVGVAAVQIGKLLGARVVAVTRGADKAAFLWGLGADAVVDTAALPGADAGAGAGAASSGGSAVAVGKGGGGGGAAAAAAAALVPALKAAAPEGVDVVFDPVGGAFLPAAFKALAWGAQYLVIGFAAGSIPKVAANLLLVKNVTMHGVFWGSYMTRDYNTLKASMDQVLAWVGQGKLQVHVSHTFPLERVTEALGVMMRRQVQGKVVLAINAQPSASRL